MIEKTAVRMCRGRDRRGSVPHSTGPSEDSSKGPAFRCVRKNRNGGHSSSRRRRFPVTGSRVAFGLFLEAGRLLSALFFAPPFFVLLFFPSNLSISFFTFHSPASFSARPGSVTNPPEHVTNRVPRDRAEKMPTLKKPGERFAGLQPLCNETRELGGL